MRGKKIFGLTVFTDSHFNKNLFYITRLSKQICLIFHSCHICQVASIMSFFPFLKHLFCDIHLSLCFRKRHHQEKNRNKIRIEGTLCARLQCAEKISTECHCRISGSTLRRLFGLGVELANREAYTLDR